MKVTIPHDYDPLNDRDYMNPVMLAYFRDLLEKELEQIKSVMDSAMSQIKDFSTSTGDECDMASSETNRNINIRITDRHGKLVNKIKAAIRRIDSGDYGYCEVSGEEIGVHRLLARPMATMTIKEQEKHEMNENITESYQESQFILGEDAPEIEE